MYHSTRLFGPLGMLARVVRFSTFVLIAGSFALADSLPVNQIVAFGDSLTDTGNASIATLGVQPGAGYAYRSIPGLPFQVGEFTTGTSGLWIDQFAAKAGLPDPQPFLAPSGGTNYAVASAQTGSNGLDGVGDQLGVYLAGKTSVPSTSLYSFWAGANDIIAGNNPITAADSLEANIATLAGEGGKYFLWFNLPLLGDTPRGKSLGVAESTALNLASLAFNAEWAQDIHALDQTDPGIVLVGVDIQALFNQIGNDPGIFTFDGLHPTSAADAFIADLALNDFEAAVPEPASAALALIGFCGLLAVAPKLKAKDRC